jgi:hypothetical protein
MHPHVHTRSHASKYHVHHAPEYIRTETSWLVRTPDTFLWVHECTLHRERRGESCRKIGVNLTSDSTCQIPQQDLNNRIECFRKYVVISVSSAGQVLLSYEYDKGCEKLLNCLFSSNFQLFLFPFESCCWRDRKSYVIFLLRMVYDIISCAPVKWCLREALFNCP